MPRQKTDGKEISIKDTKQDIWDAYQSILTEIQEKPLSETTTKRVEKMAGDVKEKLVEDIERFSKTLNDSLNEIADNFTEASKILTQLSVIHVQKQKVYEDEEKQRLIARKREEEEYTYEFDKRKKRQEEELKEAKQKEEVEIALRKSELDKEENEVRELKAQVKEFEQQLENAIKDTQVRITKELTDKLTHEKALSDQKAKATEDLLVQKIESLNEIVEKQTDDLKQKEEALGRTSQQLTRIAERAVEKGTSQVTQTSSKV